MAEDADTIRWDLYPVIHEEQYRYGGSYYEKQEWWTRPRPKKTGRSLWYALKDNFYMGEYYKRNPLYWLFLLPWHLGFIFIIMFHILCFFSAIAMVGGLQSPLLLRISRDESFTMSCGDGRRRFCWRHLRVYRYANYQIG